MTGLPKAIASAPPASLPMPLVPLPSPLNVPYLYTLNVGRTLMVRSYRAP